MGFRAGKNEIESVGQSEIPGGASTERAQKKPNLRSESKA